MRKNILMGISAIAIAFGALNATAQEKPKIDARNFLPPYEEFLSQQLELTPEQVAKFKIMREEDASKMLPLFDAMEQTRKDMDTIREDNMKKFEGVLTIEQKEKFEQFKAQREEHRKQMDAKMKARHEKRIQKMKEKGEMPKDGMKPPYKMENKIHTMKKSMEKPIDSSAVKIIPAAELKKPAQ